MYQPSKLVIFENFSPPESLLTRVALVHAGARSRWIVGLSRSLHVIETEEHLALTRWNGECPAMVSACWELEPRFNRDCAKNLHRYPDSGMTYFPGVEC